jgi:sporulation protein YlmC with PRC-barrel domain
MRILHKSTGLFSLLLMLALVSSACTPSTAAPVIVGGDPSVTTATTPEATPADAAATIPQSSGNFGVVGAGDGYMMLATALLGREVVSSEADKLGNVDDFLIDQATGDVPFALISHGGFLGIGQDQVAVPLSAFSLGLEENNLVLNLTADQFETFPNIEIDDNWPVGLDTGWDADLRNFWNNAGFDVRTLEGAGAGTVVRASQLIDYGFSTGTGNELATGRDAAPAVVVITTPVAVATSVTSTTTSTDSNTTGDLALPHEAGASDTGGAEIGNTGLGNVVDYIIDLSQGRVVYAVLSFTELATFGEEWSIVPFQAIEAGPLGDQLLLDQGIDTSLLTAAPSIRGDNLRETDFFAPGWDDEINTYWRDQGYQLN